MGEVYAEDAYYLPPGAPADAEGARGKLVVIWKRIDGRWRIWADGFSSIDPVDTP